MNTNEQEIIDSTIDTETTENEVELELEDDSTEVVEDIDSLPEWAKKKILTEKAQKDHWKKKATEKKEVVENKKEVKETVTPKENGISQTDLYALIRANVAEEDIQEVVDYAKLKNIPVSQALKSNVVKTILSEREEERKTANATNVGKAKSAPSRASEETLLEKARSGELPERDEDIIRLVKARKGIK